MPGLFLGSVPVDLAGASRLMLAGNQIWPAAAEAGPEVVWTMAAGASTIDWSGQDYAEGDVIFAFTSGRFGANTVGGTVYPTPVVTYGFAQLHNNGNSNPSSSLSCKVLNAGNIGVTTVGVDSTSSIIIWCVRGLDLGQFATTLVSGYPVVAATLHAFASVTGNINSPGITAPAGGIVFTMGTVNGVLITNTPPAGYTLVDEYAVNVGTQRSMGVAYKTGVPAGAEDPAAWTGAAGTENNTRTYTLALAAAA